ncbi:MAG: S8 family serine peptidase, partial [Acidimicrobiia bacterium]
LTCFGLHNTVATRTVDGGGIDRRPDDALEADLDIEDAAATAPGASIVSYEGPNTEVGYLDVWSAIVNDDKAKLGSTSWGECEPSQSTAERDALHPLFLQAAAQGQTIFAASGDSGSEDCFSDDASTALAVDSPGNDPYVTAVGGTSLIPNVALANPDHEPAWNDCLDSVGLNCAYRDGGAGGGGLSQAYAKPAWQPIASASTCGTGCRQVPDLSANAGTGEIFESEGQWQLIGGTSVAAPKLAGIAADISSGCVTSIGAFNPKLYALAKTGVYNIALRDVPAGQGNNDLTHTNANRYQTAASFDLATGLGTPLAPGLACPEITHVSPTTAAAGAHVTITGIALARATINFGTKTARVLSRSTTSATVIVPKNSGDVHVSATDPIGSGTRRTAFAYLAAATHTANSL